MAKNINWRYYDEFIFIDVLIQIDFLFLKVGAHERIVLRLNPLLIVFTRRKWLQGHCVFAIFI